MRLSANNLVMIMSATSARVIQNLLNQVDALKQQNTSLRNARTNSDEHVEEKLKLTTFLAVAKAARLFKQLRPAHGRNAVNSIPKRTVSLWKSSSIEAKSVVDVWAKYKIERIPAEHVLRHKYNVDTDGWDTDDAIVKMHPKMFDEGAQRACFRAKKLSQIGLHVNAKFQGWKAANNYVAKHYKDESMGARSAYYDDVKMQCRAIHFADLYNVHIKKLLQAPLTEENAKAKKHAKQIIFIQIYVIEFIDRLNSPLYCLERFIEGKYIKHNSNSGFVEEEYLRVTPQVFSHFSFHVSGGQAMVVDIQGVSDLYTDPQVHTFDYGGGDGDLGPMGMALFFGTYAYRPLAKALGIPEFPLAPSESERVWKNHATTSSVNIATLSSRLGLKTQSRGTQSKRRAPPAPATNGDGTATSLTLESGFTLPAAKAPVLVAAGTGPVHLEMAKHNLYGRLTDSVPDLEACLFHLYRAAEAGCAQSTVVLAKLYAGLPQDMMPDGVTFAGVDAAAASMLFKTAAALGDTEAALTLGMAQQKGASWACSGDDVTVPQDWAEASRLLLQAADAIEARELLKAHVAAAGAGGCRVWEVDDEVQAAYAGGDDWYPAVVKAVNSSDDPASYTYTVYYPEDAETEEGVSPKFMQEAAAAEGEADEPEEEEEEEEDEEFVAPLYEVLGNLGSMFKDGGFGLDKDAGAAAKFFAKAAQCAQAAGQPKASMQYSELAEAC